MSQSKLASLLALLLCAASACVGDVQGDGPELDEAEQALHYGTVVTSRPSGSAVSRVVTVVTTGGGSRQSCTGTLLTSRWVLTAAHCIDGAVDANGKVILGYYISVSSGGLVRRALKNPTFRRNPESQAAASERMALDVADIALIEMDSPTNPELSKPVPIWRGDLPAGTWLHCYGYGLPTPVASPDEFGTLREAWLPTRSLTYADDDELSPRVGFTLGWNGNQSIALGDSGGPCIYESGGVEWLAGIHSATTTDYYGNIVADEVAPAMYIGWIASLVSNEINQIRFTYGGNVGASTDVTRQGTSYIFTPFWQCSGQSTCNYPLDNLGSSYTGGGGDVTATWQCGIYDFATYAVNIPSPIAGKTLTLSCPSPTLYGIQIQTATYGANCGAAYGNQTQTLAAACGGRTTCSYAVDYRRIGDPAPGCSKTYDVRYTCGSGGVRTTTLPAEAGFGSVLNLNCTPPRIIRWNQKF